MDLHAPTFRSLNKAQRRALLLRDRLRATEIHELDKHIEGIGQPEPPHYRLVNGTIEPPLVLATLKASATRFDLGNVRFEDKGSGQESIHRAYLVVEDGQFELLTEDALPVNDRVFESEPIHSFIAKSTVPLFEAKFNAIMGRLNKINDVRQAAYNATDKPMSRFRGEQHIELRIFHSSLTSTRRSLYQSSGTLHSTAGRLTVSISGRIPGSYSTQAAEPKRKPGDPVLKHVSNKRSKIGLDTIPDTAKSATFDKIPSKIKIGLFDNVVKTAFPNFDNLMMASWNVVSIYSNVGTDFPELHKAIGELKSTLQDFEEECGGQVVREEPKMRHDLFAAAAYRGRQPLSDAKLVDTANNTSKGHSSEIPFDDSETTVVNRPSRDPDSLFVGSHSPEDVEVDTRPRASQPVPRMSQIHDSKEIRRPNRLEVNRNSDARRERERSMQHFPTIRQDQLSDPFGPTTSLQAQQRPHVSTWKKIARATELERQRSMSVRPRDPEEQREVGSELSDRDNESDEDEIVVVDKTKNRKKRSLAEMPLEELKRIYEHYKSRHMETFGGYEGMPQPYLEQLSRLRVEIAAREGAEDEEDDDSEVPKLDEKAIPAQKTPLQKTIPTSSLLGSSMLGAKKASSPASANAGKAPIAPMVHNSSHKPGQSQGFGTPTKKRKVSDQDGLMMPSKKSARSEPGEGR